MGYNLSIGQAEMEFNKEYSHLSIDVQYISLPEAPAFGEPTDNSNQRWPSYSVWRSFTKSVGLEDLFFDKEFEGNNGEQCLIREHPGFTVITDYHKGEIDKAYADFYKNNPSCKAGYSPLLDDTLGIYEDNEWPECNNQAVRLEWLKFWVDWSLDNCEIPIFKNT